MIRKKSILLPFLLLFAYLGAAAQTADEIINKNIEALGGKDKLQSIKSIYQEGVAIMQNGNEINSKSWRVQDKLYRQEISFGMGNIVIIVAPKQGWKSNPRNGGAFEPMNEEQVKSMQTQLDCAGPLVDYAAKGSKAELMGKDTVNGNECYKLKLTLASGQYIIYSIDAKTGYILRETRKGNGMFGGGGRNAGGKANPDAEFNVDYSDYQKTPDGYIFPFSITMGGVGPKTNVEKIEVNKPVDVAALGKPSN